MRSSFNSDPQSIEFNVAFAAVGTIDALAASDEFIAMNLSQMALSDDEFKKQ